MTTRTGSVPAGSGRSRAGPWLGLAAVVVLADQVGKAWAWRHAGGLGRVTVDTGAGALDAFVGGTANAVMSDPLLGAVADVLVASVLLVVGLRVLSRRRSGTVLGASTVLLAGSTSNLLDRFGLHRVTAPGSARGVVNWISLGGGASPANAADLLIVTALATLGAVALSRVLRRHLPSVRRRALLLAVAAVVTAVSLAGVHGARDGVTARPVAPPGPLRAVGGGTGRAVPTPGAVDRGAPAVAAQGSAPAAVIERVVASGDRVTVTWPGEAVTVTGRTVLGWRTDGVSTLYLQAVVDGPASVELYLPPVDARTPGSGRCLWRAVPPGVGTAVVWECGADVAPLAMARTPVRFP